MEYGMNQGLVCPFGLQLCQDVATGSRNPLEPLRTRALGPGPWSRALGPGPGPWALVPGPGPWAQTGKEGIIISEMEPRNLQSPLKVSPGTSSLPISATARLIV